MGNIAGPEGIIPVLPHRFPPSHNLRPLRFPGI